MLNTLDAEVASWLPLVRGRPILSRAGILACPDGRTRNVCPTIRLTICRRCRCRANTIGSTRLVRRRRRWRPVARASDICRGLETFRGLPQRLERIAAIDGRQFYNDSTATTPESTIAALRSLDAPVWLLAGGKSKGFDFGPLAAEIVEPCARSGVFRIGSAGIARARRCRGLPIPLHGRRDDGGGARLVLVALAAGRGRGVVAGLRQHRPVPQLSPARRAVCRDGSAVGRSTQSLESQQFTDERCIERRLRDSPPDSSLHQMTVAS